MIHRSLQTFVSTYASRPSEPGLAIPISISHPQHPIPHSIQPQITHRPSIRTTHGSESPRVRSITPAIGHTTPLFLSLSAPFALTCPIPGTRESVPRDLSSSSRCAGGTGGWKRNKKRKVEACDWTVGVGREAVPYLDGKLGTRGLGWVDDVLVSWVGRGRGSRAQGCWFS